MENILINENIKNLIKESKQLSKLYKKEEETKRKYQDLWYKMNDKIITFDEYKKEVENEETEKKALAKKIQLQKIKIGILQNNVTTNIMTIFKNTIFGRLKKFENKNIGEARKKEIENIIEEILENYGIIASCYFSLSSFSFELCTFTISVYENYNIAFNQWRNSEYKDFHNKIVDKIEITIGKETGENGEIKKIPRYPQRSVIIGNYIEYSKKLQNNYIKSVEKIEKLKKEIENIRHSNNEIIYNNLYDTLYINN